MESACADIGFYSLPSKYSRGATLFLCIPINVSFLFSTEHLMRFCVTVAITPFLKIDIVPEAFEGTINRESGKVDFEFKAKFLFSVGSICKAPPLMVMTSLRYEESKDDMKSGRGKRMDEEGNCRPVGVAKVDLIDDFLMNFFFALPIECLADFNAVISISASC
ncbi:hypothetical protein Ahy_A09g044404 [Arachis hypogaea]|uniref:Uncharacterized protein n=1 Tax=Arachis hypogaea TaxID=3818 RepID=A0A445BK15_ARAHY|nr:hypothetical protein Ahy_A09g044404 [Arachis hypogaea]